MGYKAKISSEKPNIEPQIDIMMKTNINKNSFPLVNLDRVANAFDKAFISIKIFKIPPKANKNEEISAESIIPKIGYKNK